MFSLFGKRQISNVGQKKRCIANYKCTADNEDELSFDPGEVIVVLNSEEDDWWVSSTSRVSLFCIDGISFNRSGVDLTYFACFLLQIYQN